MTHPIQAAVLEKYGLQCLRENLTIGVGRSLKAVPAPDFSPGSGFLNPREHSRTSIEGFSPGGGASDSIPRDGRCVCNPLRRECTFLKGTAFRPYVIASDTDPALAAEGRSPFSRHFPIGMKTLWDHFRPTAFGTISLQRNCHPDRSVAQWRDLRFLFRFSRKLPGHYLCD
jgi:hypothetical protein